MQISDAIAMLDLGLMADGFDRVHAVHRPRFLGDDGSSDVAADPAVWFSSHGMTYIRGSPRHPRKRRWIERWHRTLRNRILLEHASPPDALENRIAAFVEHGNHICAHNESLGDLTPTDVHLGRGEKILHERASIGLRTLTDRRLRHHAQAA